MGKCRPNWRIPILMCLIINAVHPQLQEKPMNPCELETLLQELTYPDEGNELHAASLRHQLRQLLENSPLTDYQASGSAEPNVELLDKRMISSLARNGLMTSGKRNIGAMARLGMLRSGNNDDSGNKRSIATLAKNGQLPSREPETDNESDNQWVSDKRNIGSLARSGQLGNGKRSIASLARSYELPAYGKRNLASIVRSSVRPVTGGSSYKRNMAALARGNMLPLFGEEYKRNVGALARDWSLPTTKVHSKREASYQEYEKRNIGAMRNSPVHGTKVKRQSSYDDYPSSNAELLEPVFQSSPIDYVELNEVMNQLYPYYENSPPVSDTFHEDKRFLGSLVRDGWSNYRPMSAEKRNIGSLARLGLLRSDLNDYGQQRKYSHQQQDKRHIGALARSGWLPAFRPVRGGRFSRSGRARSGSTPYKSDFGSQPPPLVNAVKPPSFPPAHSAGAPMAVDFTQQHGANNNNHPGLQHSIAAVYEDHFIPAATISEPFPTNNQYRLMSPINYYYQTPNNDISNANNDNIYYLDDNDNNYTINNADDNTDDDDDEIGDRQQEKCLIRLKGYLNDFRNLN